MAGGKQAIIGCIGWRPGLLLVAIALATGCDTQSDRALEVHRRTITNGAAASAMNGPQRTANGVSFAWNVQSPLSWDGYRTSVIEEFRLDFAVLRSDASWLVLSRREDGDVYRLEFQSASNGTEVHVILSASAD